MAIGNNIRNKDSVTYSKIGPWEAAGEFVRSLPQHLRRSAMTAQEKAARRYLRIIKTHLELQDLPWAPHSSKYSNRTGKILVDSGHMKKAIRYWQYKYVVYIGIKRGIKHRENGQELADIASFHEYGTSKMPARPLFAPSLEEMGGASGVANIIVKKMEEVLTFKASGTGFEITRR